ncbi:MAG: amidohydrolase family protein [Fuerstiella sp.]
MKYSHITTSARRILLIAIAVFAGNSCTSVSATDEVPGAPQSRPVALTNAVIHTIFGPPIENGTIVFEDGKITEIGKKVKSPKNAQVVDLKGQHVYPSLIEALSQIGLREISAVRATIDSSETGSINPNVKAHVAVNPDSEVIPVTRANGILIAVSAPSGGRVSGYASVMQLDGWTYEQMTLQPNVAMVVNWPSPPSSGESPGLKELRELLDDARAYKAARDTEGGGQKHDIRLEGLLPVVAGEVPMLAKADDASEIQAAVAFAVEQGLKVIIFGGHDAEQCADLLKKHNVPVIIDSVHRRPVRRHEAYDVAYTLPARLSSKGVKFCISCYDRSETWNTRNLPYHAATAAAHGLSYEDALRSVTLFPAEILGIADRVGSLEKGKDATIIITTGDPLETDTQVTKAYVQGREVQLTSRHTRLNDKYEQKYRQQGPRP